MELNKDIQDTIEKHLPAQIGDILKKRLEDIPHLENKIKTLEIDLKNARASSDSYRKGEQELRDKLNDHQELEHRFKEIEKRERNLELELCRKDVQCAQEKSQQIFGLVNAVFRNPIYKESVAKTSFGSEMVPVVNNGYTSTQSMPTNSNENTTTTRYIDDVTL